MKHFSLILFFITLFNTPFCQMAPIMPTSDTMLTLVCKVSENKIDFSGNEYFKNSMWGRRVGNDITICYTTWNENSNYEDTLSFAVKKIYSLVIEIDSGITDQHKINSQLVLLSSVDLSDLKSLSIISSNSSTQKNDLMNIDILKKIKPDKLKMFSITGNHYYLKNFLNYFNQINSFHTDQFVNKEFMQMDSLVYFNSYQTENLKNDVSTQFLNHLVNTNYKNSTFIYRGENDLLSFVGIDAFTKLEIPIQYFFNNEGAFKKQVNTYNFMSEWFLEHENYTGPFIIYQDSLNGKYSINISEKLSKELPVLSGMLKEGERIGKWKVKFNTSYLEVDYDKIPKPYIFPENGSWEYKYPNGTTCIKGDFKNGEKVNAWLFYNPDASLSSIKYFKNDTLYDHLYDAGGSQLRESNFAFPAIYEISYPNGYSGYFCVKDECILLFKNGEVERQINKSTSEYYDLLVNNFSKNEYPLYYFSFYAWSPLYASYLPFNEYDSLESNFPQTYFLQYQIMENIFNIDFGPYSARNQLPLTSVYNNGYMSKYFSNSRKYYDTILPVISDSLEAFGRFKYRLPYGIWRKKLSPYHRFFLEYDYSYTKDRYFFPQNGIWEYKYRTGSTCIKGKFEKGKKTGTWFFYYPDSTLASIKHFKDDVPYGSWLNPDYESDQKINITPPSDTKFPNGFCGFYYLDGQIIEEYENGNLVRKINRSSDEFDEIIRTYNRIK